VWRPHAGLGCQAPCDRAHATVSEVCVHVHACNGAYWNTICYLHLKYAIHNALLHWYQSLAIGWWTAHRGVPGLVPGARSFQEHYHSTVHSFAFRSRAPAFGTQAHEGGSITMDVGTRISNLTSRVCHSRRVPCVFDHSHEAALHNNVHMTRCVLDNTKKV
jgi:hypothetical protein